VPAVQSDIAKALLRLHTEVRRTLASHQRAGLPVAGAGSGVDRAQLFGKNRKGDRQRGFDVAADVAVRRLLEGEFGSGIILSEESEDYRFGETAPAYRFIVDPVDGSDNWARGLPLSSVAVAVLPADGPIALDRVAASLVGGLEEDTPIVAIRGEGAHRGPERLQTSGTRRIADAFVSCELNHFAPTAQVGELFSTARAVRCYGCASRAIALVACGAIDAHIDVRSRLTPESFLAAAAILCEAGGSVLDAQGNTLGKFAHLCQTTTIVATATEELAREIVDALAGHHVQNHPAGG
jgi:myo-inositol-1(or 4)-monophosphatase